MLWGGGVESFLQQLHEEQYNETKSISGDSSTALQVPTTLQPPEKAHSCVKAILSTGCPKPSAFFPSFLCFFARIQLLRMFIEKWDFWSLEAHLLLLFIS